MHGAVGHVGLLWLWVDVDRRDRTGGLCSARRDASTLGVHHLDDVSKRKDAAGRTPKLLAQAKKRREDPTVTFVAPATLARA